MEAKQEIKKLEERKEMAVFQKRITTSLLTAMEYDQEIDAIDRRLQILSYR